MKKTVSKLLVLGFFFLSISGIANAASFTFDGNITYHNDIVEILFEVEDDATNVRVWTDSFMDATNFDPITALWEWDATENDWLRVDENDDNDSVAVGQTYYDSGFVLSTLTAGTYMFTVATYANFATGTYLSDGFAYDNATPILLSEWTQPASHYAMGTYYRVNLDGVDSAEDLTPTVPEPTTMLLFGTGMVGLAAVGRRRKN